MNIDTLRQKTDWVFDMDGTLTHAVHDFDAIRATLNLPAGRPILESIEKLPQDEAALVHQRLDEIEYEIAEQSIAQPFADELLGLLQKADCNIGIVTRNGHGIAKATLKACGLDAYFTNETIVSRNCCKPKPHPDGIELLLNRWQANAANAVMVGDFQFDMDSGKRANVATVHLDTSATFAWPDITDVGVQSLQELAVIWQ